MVVIRRRRSARFEVSCSYTLSLYFSSLFSQDLSLQRAQAVLAEAVSAHKHRRSCAELASLFYFLLGGN
jgi:hypothetical protein